MREPKHPHDPLVLAILSVSGTRVVYLKRDRAARIAPKMDCGYAVRVIVGRVKGPHLEGATLGLVRRLNMEGEEPELPGRWAAKGKVGD